MLRHFFEVKKTMPLEWLIDIIKEWVIAQAYATQAWVEAKVYATEAWVLSKGYAGAFWVDLRLDDLRTEILAAIAALKTWVQNQNYLQTGFVDRGDPPDYDYTAGDFIKDSAWHELDLSAIVPAGAKAVLFRVDPLNPNVGNKFVVRKHGNVNDINTAKVYIMVSGVPDSRCFSCSLDSDRKIDYWITSGTWMVLDFTVKGWWF